MTSTRQRLLPLLVPLALVAAACGGGDEAADTTDKTKAETTDAPAPETTAAPETTSVATTPPEDTEPEIAGYADVQPAVVQIVAQGTFRDPEVGYADGSGAGSGFVISPDGLAVTNNHVVAGAATLEVYVGGDIDQAYNATIVGVSECNDLALIDIDADEDLPSLDWYDDEIRAGLDVYAAGYPLGDPEFTLTRGIIAKAEAGGDLTGTSSIDHTVEHDANLQPGGSGGPLVSADGRVVAVNYAGGALATTTAQFYGIASDLAQPVIDRLQDGDFESLGINGWAVYDESIDLAGVWVAGVAAGSAASATGVLPGDVITSMNGLPVGTDGTFKDYCDVIRTAGEGGPIAVEVLRRDTEEVLRGEFNGTPLELSFSFAEEVGDEIGQDTTGPEAPATDYETVTDDLGRIYVDVPRAWTSRDTAPYYLDEGSPSAYIAASTDLAGFLDGWTAPGILYVQMPASRTAEQAVTDPTLFTFDGLCTDGGIYDYADARFTGKYRLWLDCPGGADIVVLGAQPAEQSFTALLYAQIVTDADLDALDQALYTFNTTN